MQKLLNKTSISKNDEDKTASYGIGTRNLRSSSHTLVVESKPREFDLSDFVLAPTSSSKVIGNPYVPTTLLESNFENKGQLESPSPKDNSLTLLHNQIPRKKQHSEHKIKSKRLNQSIKKVGSDNELFSQRRNYAFLRSEDALSSFLSFPTLTDSNTKVDLVHARKKFLYPFEFKADILKFTTSSLSLFSQFALMGSKIENCKEGYFSVLNTSSFNEHENTKLNTAISSKANAFKDTKASETKVWREIFQLLKKGVDIHIYKEMLYRFTKDNTKTENKRKELSDISVMKKKDDKKNTKNETISFDSSAQTDKGVLNGIESVEIQQDNISSADKRAKFACHSTYQYNFSFSSNKQKENKLLRIVRSIIIVQLKEQEQQHLTTPKLSPPHSSRFSHPLSSHASSSSPKIPFAQVQEHKTVDQVWQRPYQQTVNAAYFSHLICPSFFGMPKLMNDQLDENIRFSSDCFSWWNNERIRKESIQNSKSLSYSSFNHGAFDQSLWTNETGTTSAEFRKGDEDDLNRLSTLSPKSVESPENSEGRAIEKKRTSQSRLRGQSRSPNETSHQPISRSVRKPKRRSRRRSWFSSRKKRRRAAERMRMRNEAASEESEQTAEEETVSDEEYKEAHRRSRKAEKGEEGDDEGNEEEEEEEEGEKEDDEKEAEAEEDSRDAESDPFMSMSSTDSQEIRRSSEKSKEKPKQKQELTQRSKQELSIQQKYPSMASQKAQLLMPIASFNPLHFSSKLPSALNSHSLSNSMTSLAAQAQQQFTQHQLSGADSIHSSFSSDALNNHPASASSSSSSYRSNVPSFSNFPEFASAFALTSSSGTSLPSSVELLASKAKRGRSQIGKGDLIDENQPNESTHGHQIPARTLPSSSASSSSFPSSATNTREDFGFSTHSNIPLPFSSNTSSASFRAQSASQQASNSTSFAPSSSTAPSLLGSSMPTAPKYSSFNSLSAFQALHRSPYPVQRAAPALSYNQQSAVSTKPSFFGANPLLVSGNSSALLSSSNPASFSSTSPSSASASSSSSSHLTSPPRNSSFTSSSSFHSNTTTDSASSYHSPHTHTSASFNPSPFSQMNLPISPSPLSHPQRTPSLSSSPLHASSPTVSISPPTIPVKNLKIHLKANNSLQGKEQKVLKQFTSFEQDENIRTKESQLNLPS